MRMRTIIIYMVGIVFLFAASSCGIGSSIEKAVDKAVSSIDAAIASLETESANWQQIVEELRGDIGSTVDGLDARLNAIVARGIAATGVEARCTVDFLGKRAIQSLYHVRAWLLKIPSPAFTPVFCQAVPSGVERHLVENGTISQLELYGYDFDGKTVLDVAEGSAGEPVRVFLRTTTGQEQDVSNHLDRPTHYLFTLNLGGTGVRLRENSARLMFRWRDSLIGSVAVIQPQTPVCEEIVRSYSVGQVTVVPTLRGNGDAEFKGHGPSVAIVASVSQSGDKILATLTMDARETKSDWTRGYGQTAVEVTRGEAGYRIDSILTPTYRPLMYTDTGHGVDERQYGAGDVVRWIKSVGDTSGNDVGSGTQATALFNPVRVKLVQNVDCVPESDVQRLIQEHRLSDAMRLRLEPDSTRIRDATRERLLELDRSRSEFQDP